MSNRRKYIIVFLILTAIFFIAVSSILYILFLHKTTVSSQEDLRVESTQESKVQEQQQAYQDAVLELSNQNYDKAYEHLKTLRDAGVRSSAFRDAEELFYYAAARRSFARRDIPTASANIQKIPADYHGLFSLDAQKLRKELSASDANNMASSDDVAASQRLLASQMEYVYTRLSARLDSINNERKQTELKYKQGTLTVKAYYTAKAQHDLDEQNARIEALDEEVALIRAAQYPSAEEKELAIKTAETRRKPLLEKQAAAQNGVEEVDRVTREFSKVR